MQRIPCRYTSHLSSAHLLDLTAVVAGCSFRFRCFLLSYMDRGRVVMSKDFLPLCLFPEKKKCFMILIFHT